MSKFENPEPENDFLADDDYLIDEDLRELETQLAADAKFLHATYPSNSSKSDRIAKLISACVSPSNSEKKNEFDAAVSIGDKYDVAGSKRSISSVGSASVTWQNIGLGVVASACLIICVFWYFPSQPHSIDGDIIESVATIENVDAGFAVTPVSMSLPDKFLNASQPELEAMFDNMCPECDDSGDYMDLIQHMDF